MRSPKVYWQKLVSFLECFATGFRFSYERFKRHKQPIEDAQCSSYPLIRLFSTVIMNSLRKPSLGKSYELSTAHRMLWRSVLSAEESHEWHNSGILLIHLQTQVIHRRKYTPLFRHWCNQDQTDCQVIEPSDNFTDVCRVKRRQQGDKR